MAKISDVFKKILMGTNNISKNQTEEVNNKISLSTQNDVGQEFKNFFTNKLQDKQKNTYLREMPLKSIDINNYSTPNINRNKVYAIEKDKGILEAKAPIRTYNKNLNVLGANINEDKKSNLINDIKNFVTHDIKNLASTAKASVPLMISNTLQGMAVSQRQEMGKDRFSKQSIQDYKQSLQETINSNKENTKSWIGEYLNDLTPSLVQNATTIGLSMINPVVGMTQFSTSAAGGYYDDAINKGLTKDQAYNYAAVMTGFESLTEKILSKEFVSGLGKIVTKGATKEAGKSAIKGAIKNFAVSGIENFIQEAAMEPLDELTKNAVTGNKLTSNINWEDMKERMLKAGTAGFISSAILGGASLGVGSCIQSANKLQNGQEVSIQEINQNIKELEEKGIDAKGLANNIFKNISDNIQNNQNIKIDSEGNIQTNNGLNIIQTKNNLLESLQQKANDNTRLSISEENLSNNEVIGLTAEELKTETIKTSAERFKDFFKSDEIRNNVVNSLEKLQEIRNKANQNNKLKILFDNTIQGNGIIVTDKEGNRTIRIKPQSKKSVEFILMHELTHDIKSTKEYTELQEIIAQYNNKQFSFEDAKANLTQIYQDFYQKNNLDMSNLDINEEATADMIGTMLGDQNFINQLSIKKPNVFQRIKKWIDKQIVIFKSKDKDTTRFLYDVRDKFEKALRNGNSELQENTKFSIQSDSNGKRYVKVDTDQSIFEGVNKRDYNKIAKMYIQDYLIGNTKLQSSENVIIDSKSANKYTNPTQNPSYMSEKMKLTPELKNVLEIAEKTSVSAPTKENSKYRSWEYYKFKFELDGKAFEGTINIGIDKNDNKHFYEINKIHSIPNSSVSTNKADTMNLYNKSIAPINNNVNDTTKYSIQENENNVTNIKEKWQKYLNFIDDKTGEKKRNNFVLPTAKGIQKNQKIIAPLADKYKNQNTNEYLDNLTTADDINVDTKFEEITNTRIVQDRKKKPTIKSFKEAAKNTKNQLVQKIVNKLQPIDKLAEKSNNLELKYKADKSQGASGVGQYNIGKAQTDINGKRIGKSLNDIFEVVKDNNIEKEFSEYMYLKHNSDREAVYKPIFGEDISSQTSNKLAKQYEQKYPEFKEYAKDVYNYLNNEKELLVEAGMIDRQTANYLNELYSNYAPVERNIEKEQKKKGDTLTSGTGIKKATGGNSDIMTLSEAMAMRTMKLRRAVIYNDLIKETAKTLKNVEIEKGFTALDPSMDINSLFDTENAPVQEIDGKYKALYFENGEGHQFEITKDLYEALKPSQTYDLENTLPAKAIQKASKLHRDMLTKFSLTFPIKNAIKDIQDVTLNSKYLLKFPKNYIKAIQEIKTDGDLYNLYMANGGGNNTYFDYETGIQETKSKNPIKWTGERISAINETIEQLPRLAEFISTLEAGGSVNEALYNAADITTNFKRGGEIAKALNRNGATFLNASIQGFDKFYRNFSGQNGVKGYAAVTAKAVAFGMIPALLNHMFYHDDEDYQDLRNNDKDLYYLFKYDDGKFIRIPKGRALSVFGVAARRTLEKMKGDEDAFDGMLETMSNQVAPNNPLTDNVIAPIVQAARNKSWFGNDIVSSRLQKELPKNQYDESTDDFSIWLGSKLNISPKKINYVIDQYSGGIGDVLLPLTTKKASNKGNVFKDQFTTDSVLKNNNVSKFYDTIEKQTKIVNDSNATDEDKLQLMYLNEVNSSVSDLYKQKREIQMSDMKNKEKSEKVREIQDEINQIMKEALNSYKNVDKENDIAKIKDTTYLNILGEWKTLSDTDKENIESIMQAGGEEKDYLRYKIDNIYIDKEGNRRTKSNNEKLKYISENIENTKSKKVLYENTIGKEDGTYKKFKGSIDTYLKYKTRINDAKNKNGGKELKSNQKIDILLNSNFKDVEIQNLYEATLLSDSYDIYPALKASKINIKEYLKYKQQDFSSDKEDDGTVNGKTVSGSAKKKTYEYINSMNITYEQKLLLLGSKYKLTDTERTKLANYINTELGISKKEKLELYEKMKGFTVYKDGRVTW